MGFDWMPILSYEQYQTTILNFIHGDREHPVSRNQGHQLPQLFPALVQISLHLQLKFEECRNIGHIDQNQYEEKSLWRRGTEDSEQAKKNSQDFGLVPEEQKRQLS